MILNKGTAQTALQYSSGPNTEVEYPDWNPTIMQIKRGQNSKLQREGCLLAAQSYVTWKIGPIRSR
jgi:hypothetical protein